MKGLSTEANYPYTAKNGTCSPKGTKISNLTGSTSIAPTTDAIKLAVMKQPVAVAVDSTNWGPYLSGIFSCNSSTIVNHAVVIVGYTSTYWII
jgi:KDEL-tailed cysteine endopeptidase